MGESPKKEQKTKNREEEGGETLVRGVHIRKPTFPAIRRGRHD